MKYLYLPILALFLFACSNDEVMEGCIDQLSIGEFDILESSSEQAFDLYRPYERVFYRNAENDTIEYWISIDETINSFDRLCTYKCKLDSNILVQGVYGATERRIVLSPVNFIQINNDDMVEVLGTGVIQLSLTPRLHLDDPCLGLVGDFVDLLALQPSLDFTLISSVMSIPLDLRTFPTSLEDLQGFDFSEEVEIGGQIYSDVYSTNDDFLPEIKIQMNLTDGIISIEDVDGVLWTLVGYE